MAMIDRVKYDGPKEVLAWRWPSDQLSWGTQVIVNQSQEALFFKGGQAVDILGPGTHTLKTANIPLLRSLVNIPFGDETPFAAEVYYINKAVNLDLKWGTKQPMPLLDPKYNVFLPIRAFGQFGIKVEDARKFVIQLVGTLDDFSNATVEEYFRGVLLTKVKDTIAESLVKDKISLLEITAHLEEISKVMHEKLRDDFAAFGVGLVNFFLNSVNVPEDDDSVVRLKKALAEKTEFDILGGDVYRTKRAFDTMEKAAGNEGGAAGAGMGMGMGLGAGFGMAGPMGGMMGSAMAGAVPQQGGGAQTVQCAKCKNSVSASAKFCGDCGNPMVTATAHCPQCNADVPMGAKFCGNCGRKMANAICKKCSAAVPPTAKFCGKCGEKQA